VERVGFSRKGPGGLGTGVALEKGLSEGGRLAEPPGTKGAGPAGGFGGGPRIFSRTVWEKKCGPGGHGPRPGLGGPKTGGGGDPTLAEASERPDRPARPFGRRFAPRGGFAEGRAFETHTGGHVGRGPGLGGIVGRSTPRAAKAGQGGGQTGGGAIGIPHHGTTGPGICSNLRAAPDSGDVEEKGATPVGRKGRRPEGDAGFRNPSAVGLFLGGGSARKRPSVGGPPTNRGGGPSGTGGTTAPRRRGLGKGGRACLGRRFPPPGPGRDGKELCLPSGSPPAGWGTKRGGLGGGDVVVGEFEVGGQFRGTNKRPGAGGRGSGGRGKGRRLSGTVRAGGGGDRGARPGRPGQGRSGGATVS